MERLDRQPWPRRTPITSELPDLVSLAQIPTREAVTALLDVMRTGSTSIRTRAAARLRQHIIAVRHHFAAEANAIEREMDAYWASLDRIRPVFIWDQNFGRPSPRSAMGT